MSFPGFSDDEIIEQAEALRDEQYMTLEHHQAIQIAQDLAARLQIALDKIEDLSEVLRDTVDEMDNAVEYARRHMRDILRVKIA